MEFTHVSGLLYIPVIQNKNFHLLKCELYFELILYFCVWCILYHMIRQTLYKTNLKKYRYKYTKCMFYTLYIWIYSSNNFFFFGWEKKGKRGYLSWCFLFGRDHSDTLPAWLRLVGVGLVGVEDPDKNASEHGSRECSYFLGTSHCGIRTWDLRSQTLRSELMTTRLTTPSGN